MSVRQPPVSDDFAAEPRSVDLRDYWSILRRRWRLIAAIALVGGLAGVGYSVARGPSYTATAEVVVQPVTEGPLNQQPAQAGSQVNMSTEQAIAQSEPVVQQAAGILRVPASKLESVAASKLSVTVPASTLTISNVLQISWQAKSRRAAQQGADAFASAYLSYRHHELAGQISVLEGTLQQQINSLRAQMETQSARLAGTVSASTRQILTIQLNQLSSQASTAEAQLNALPTYNDSGGTMIPAVMPGKPSGLGRSVLAGIGLILGLLVGLAVAFARDFFDDRVRDATQLEQCLGAPLLAIMPSAKAVAASDQRQHRLQSAAVAIAADPDSSAADAARILRETVMAVSSRRDLRALMVIAADTSISAGLIVAELGVALAQSGKRVLLVASDTQGSVLPQIFDVGENAGLKELLIRGGDPEAFTQSPKQTAGVVLPTEVADRLTVLPSGQGPAYPLSALDCDRMANALHKLREAHDLMLLDAQSGAGADIFALASHVDGVIVLAREAHTRSKELMALRHHLGQVDAPVVGGVLVRKVRSGRSQHTSVQPAPAGDRPAVAAPEQAPQPEPASITTLLEPMEDAPTITFPVPSALKGTGSSRPSDQGA
ncbi:MAG: hypothetical protein JO132_03030 [Streptosporangiaceae bacterium]|nr:hypothetical protein [Streptosporangiaceae bacterium]